MAALNRLFLVAFFARANLRAASPTHLQHSFNSSVSSEAQFRYRSAPENPLQQGRSLPDERRERRMQAERSKNVFTTRKRAPIFVDKRRAWSVQKIIFKITVSSSLKLTDENIKSAGINLRKLLRQVLKKEIRMCKGDPIKRIRFKQFKAKAVEKNSLLRIATNPLAVFKEKVTRSQINKCAKNAIKLDPFSLLLRKITSDHDPLLQSVIELKTHTKSGLVGSWQSPAGPAPSPTTTTTTASSSTSTSSRSTTSSWTASTSITSSSSLMTTTTTFSSASATTTTTSPIVHPSGLECTNITETVSLDANGMFTMPNWTDKAAQPPYIVREHKFNGNVSISQSPEPGRVFSEIQRNVTVVIKVSSTDTEESVQCSFTFNLSDESPPNVSLGGVTQAQTYGLDQIPNITAVAVDNVDETSHAHILVDSYSYAPGMKLEEGLHVASAKATDSNGNIGLAEPVLFEVKSEKESAFNASLQSIECVENTVFAEIDATIGLESTSSNIGTINVDSVHLLALDKNRFVLNNNMIFSKNATNENGLLLLHFNAVTSDAAITGCPTYLRVTGRGFDEVPFDFDLTLAVEKIGRKLETNAVSSPSILPSELLWPAPAISPSTTASIVPASTTFTPSALTSSTEPSLSPSHLPSTLPSAAPSMSPSTLPSPLPTATPSVIHPSTTPSTLPGQPTSNPSMLPSNSPSTMPTNDPSIYPSPLPSTLPTAAPSASPTVDPSKSPSAQPSEEPTLRYKCRWKKDPIKFAHGSSETDTDWHPTGQGHVTVGAPAGLIYGMGTGYDTYPKLPFQHIHVVESTIGKASMHMRLEALEGTLDDCKPEIQCEINPLFRGFAKINEPGHAHVDAIMSVTTDLGDGITCHKNGGNTATLALAVGKNHRPTVIWGFPWGVSVNTVFYSGNKAGPEYPSPQASDNTISTTLPRNQDGKLEKVFVKVSVNSQVTVDLKAHATFWDWFAQADGWIAEASPNIKITGRCRNGACEEVVYTFT